MWRGRRRLRQLETEIAEARAAQAELRRRLELFEMIAASAGAEAGPSAPVPPTLVAAARELRQQDFPVRLDVGGSEVIAVISGEGDPREWWAAIRRLAETGRETS